MYKKITAKVKPLKEILKDERVIYANRVGLTLKNGAFYNFDILDCEKEEMQFKVL